MVGRGTLGTLLLEPKGMKRRKGMSVDASDNTGEGLIGSSTLVIFRFVSSRYVHEEYLASLLIDALSSSIALLNALCTKL